VRAHVCFAERGLIEKMPRSLTTSCKLIIKWL
jgi:hypothetical protein